MLCKICAKNPPTLMAWYKGALCYACKPCKTLEDRKFKLAQIEHISKGKWNEKNNYEHS
jgi:hypothetical protein